MLARLLLDHRRKVAALRRAVLDCSRACGTCPQLQSDLPGLGCRMSVIDLHNLWTTFWRDCVMISAYAEPTTSSGSVVPRVPGLTTENDVIRQLRQLGAAGSLTYPSGNEASRYEPKWSDPRDVSAVIGALSVGNSNQLLAGVGFATPSPDHVRRLRNYFSHRGTTSLNKLEPLRARHPRLRSLSPEQMPTIVVERGLTLFELWARELDFMAGVAVR